MNTARINKTLFREFEIGNEYEYLNRKNLVFKISEISKKLLSKVDVEYIKNIRCSNSICLRQD